MSLILHVYTTLFIAFLIRLTTASQQIDTPQDHEARNSDGDGGWTNAYWINPQQDLTAATQAQCPSWAPINCNAIQEPSYCCTPSTYCARASDNTIGCCPWGQTCNPTIGGGAGGATWQPTTTYPPPASTVYITETNPTTTIVYAAGQNTQQWITTTTTQPQQTVVGAPQQYCSTLYAHGGNLPTTEAGTCGTILIANAAVGEKRGMLEMGGWWCGLVVVGGLVFQFRGWV